MVIEEARQVKHEQEQKEKGMNISVLEEDTEEGSSEILINSDDNPPNEVRAVPQEVNADADEDKEPNTTTLLPGTQKVNTVVEDANVSEENIDDEPPSTQIPTVTLVKDDEDDDRLYEDDDQPPNTQLPELTQMKEFDDGENDDDTASDEEMVANTQGPLSMATSSTLDDDNITQPPSQKSNLSLKSTHFDSNSETRPFKELPGLDYFVPGDDDSDGEIACGSLSRWLKVNTIPAVNCNGVG